MLVMQWFLIGLMICMEIVGFVFLIKYVKGAKLVDKDDIYSVKNHKINLTISLITLIGGVLVLICVPFVG